MRGMKRSYVRPTSGLVELNIRENIARSEEVGKKYYFNFGEVGQDPIEQGEGTVNPLLEQMQELIDKLRGK